MDDSLLGQNWCNQIHCKPCDSNLALSLDLIQNHCAQQVDFPVEKDLMMGGVGLILMRGSLLPITKTYVSFFGAFCSGKMFT